MTLLEQKMMLRLPEDMKAISWRYDPDDDVLFICFKNCTEWYKSDAWIGRELLDYFITAICDCHSGRIVGYIIQQFMEVLGERKMPMLPL